MAASLLPSRSSPVAATALVMFLSLLFPHSIHSFVPPHSNAVVRSNSRLNMQLDGVVGCVVGYSGGKARNPTYQNIQDYTEALLVEYNPNKLSYRDILQEWSGMDYPFVQQKTQYRSAIFALNDEQLAQAQDFVSELEERYKEKGPIFVDVEPVTKFYRGEEYHQDFLAKQKSGRSLRMF
ncbi:Peptide methionine sulfoxide reductase MsrA [Seminavis robusta]|uniref:peptide-methionine (S)-S-oxide reductase n=1 Tax=Seminavis robusta TaxID=568900 RepID=A0A9N8HYU8_9STRA|nr:Peptide methionine sulfoxide reductase MsrA [Seminavis robusta]|eukprot:Sro3022_g342260.1 Peptide methionine sulfoxide reductase MsrA (180) ;mRNA; r:5832-6473